jgi:hypothetical protein
MGIIRKAISGSLASVTGGASLALVQFRSDTERGTRETKKLRQELARQGQAGTSSPTTPAAPVASSPSIIQGVASRDFLEDQVSLPPKNLTPGWKSMPNDKSQEMFWDGKKWTNLTRSKQ